MYDSPSRACIILSSRTTNSFCAIWRRKGNKLTTGRRGDYALIAILHLYGAIRRYHNHSCSLAGRPRVGFGVLSLGEEKGIETTGTMVNGAFLLEFIGL